MVQKKNHFFNCSWGLGGYPSLTTLNIDILCSACRLSQANSLSHLGSKEKDWENIKKKFTVLEVQDC